MSFESDHPLGLQAESPYSRVQCDGKGGYEIVNKDKNPCTTVCTQVHEASHVADFKQRFGADTCRNKPRGYSPSRFPGYDRLYAWQTECRGYQVQRFCLEAQARDCDCKKDAEAAIADVDRQIRGFCHGRPVVP